MVESRASFSVEQLYPWSRISRATIISKIFEHPAFSLDSKENPPHLSPFTLSKRLIYYTDKGSNVYCSFLDASKAFDRLVHASLFLKLLQRQVPLVFLNIIIAWYSSLECRVRWGETMSDWFIIEAGVRQGGVLSPIFYCLYVDDLVDILCAIGIGCYLAKTFLSILLYADDMAPLAPSLKGLQTLLNATEIYCREWDILLNTKKTKNMIFGKQCQVSNLVLDSKEIEWVQSWTYLGVTFVSNKVFNCSIDAKVQSFY